MTDYSTQDISYFWEPRKAFCLANQMNKKSDVSSEAKDQCKPNLVARRRPSCGQQAFWFTVKVKSGLLTLFLGKDR